MGLGERKSRLHALARRLPGAPEVMPYYVRRSLSEQEPAPGWYMVPAGLEHPVYLGYGAVDAELSIREQLRVTAGA